MPVLWLMRLICRLSNQPDKSELYLDCLSTCIPKSLCIAFSQIINITQWGYIPGNLYSARSHTYVVGSTEYRVFNLVHVVASHGT
ncbi:uncharacterized protein DS421_16g538410 [Arachis hypogaea]|nr:uncharacterized protein DS421_16g538410 [Arachis hypogaea]